MLSRSEKFGFVFVNIPINYGLYIQTLGEGEGGQIVGASDGFGLLLSVTPAIL